MKIGVLRNTAVTAATGSYTETATSVTLGDSYVVLDQYGAVYTTTIDKTNLTATGTNTDAGDYIYSAYAGTLAVACNSNNMAGTDSFDLYGCTFTITVND